MDSSFCRVALPEAAIAEKRGHLAAFGRPFLANPDLLARMQKNAPLNKPDEMRFYTPGPKGIRITRRCERRDQIFRGRNP
jgi:2,4-dienoyl-CoA reductase-like NADH-dependent reductase (Old Yellow Enzyme family)